MPRFRPIESALTIALLASAAVTSFAQTAPADLHRLDSIAAASIGPGRTVGLVVAVAQKGEAVLMKPYGLADVEWEVPMTADALFEVGSIAKQFAAVAMLKLRDEGRLSLDDDIARFFPELGVRGQAITLRRLLSHTSGINHFSDTEEWGRRFWYPGATRADVQPYITLEPLQYPPGTAQAYNNSAFFLLGLVVEKASGQSYEEFIETRIFEPLGMSRTMYCRAGENIPRRAHGYAMSPGGVARAPMVSHTLTFAAGAVCSTAPDLVRWLQALHGGRVLTADSYAELVTPARLNDGTQLQYGLGIKVGEDSRGLRYVGHGGAGPGFRADATWYPTSQTAVVVLSNTSPTTFSPGTLGGALARALLPLPRPDRAYFTGDASELLGDYDYVAGGNQPPFSIRVVQTTEGLAFHRSGTPRAEPLPWVGGLTFYAQENVTLTFHRARGGSGPITELHRDDAGNRTVLRKRS